jgi:DNA-binding beta-propeller fold protein YncE
MKRTAITGVLITLFGLAAFPSNPARKASSVPSWPRGSQNPRISFVRAFSSGKDFNVGKGLFLKWALKKLMGKEGPEPSLMFPYGIVTDSRGRVIVTDSQLQALHVFDPGTRSYALIQPRTHDRMISPIGVATDAQDNIYVTDSFQGKVFVFDPSGKVKHIIGQPEGRYKRPTGIAIDRAAGWLYVADTLKNEIVVTDLQGHDIFRFGQSGEGDGEFNAPTQLCLNGGRLYVTDTLNARIQIFERDGKYVSGFGRLGRGAGAFDKPKGVALDSDGHVYVVEGMHDIVQIMDIQGNLLMVFGTTGSAAGEFYLPTGIHIDHNDFIYVADPYNRRIQVFRYLKENGSNGVA